MSAYREGFGPLEQRRAEVARARVRFRELEAQTDRIASQRTGRIVGSVTGLVGLAALVPALALAPRPAGEALAEPWFLGSALLALAVGFGAAAASSALRARRRARARNPAHEAREAAALLSANDMAAVEARAPWPRAAAELVRLEAPSLVLPLVLASLVLPLAAHAVVYHPIALVWGEADPLKAFSTWMLISAMIVGHAHAALAICAGLFGRKLARRTTTEILAETSARKDWVRALWITVGVAAVPGLIFFAMPPLLTLVTGLVVIPLAYRVARNVHVAERLVVDEAARELTGVRVGVEEMHEARDELAALAEVRARVEVPREERGEDELAEDEEERAAARR